MSHYKAYFNFNNSKTHNNSVKFRFEERKPQVLQVYKSEGDGLLKLRTVR